MKRKKRGGNHDAPSFTESQGIMCKKENPVFSLYAHVQKRKKKDTPRGSSKKTPPMLLRNKKERRPPPPPPPPSPKKRRRRASVFVHEQKEKEK